ncbi:hypothetical protein SAMN05192539_103938 [Paraburkholderia diazotrophica]|uniref:Uncharacterized protein n=1 Tax=Paraburkholderia diazotrophica TaxID=667676 RepID=A0A1H7E202_9BURK|nr:hypothetical protein SAMN05192539_103938 [Paraburkholderia diazotrophica]
MMIEGECTTGSRQLTDGCGPAEAEERSGSRCAMLPAEIRAEIRAEVRTEALGGKKAPAGRDRSGAGLDKSSPVLKRRSHVTRIKKPEQSKKTPVSGCRRPGEALSRAKGPPRTRATLAVPVRRINPSRVNSPFLRAQTHASAVAAHRLPCLLELRSLRPRARRMRARRACGADTLQRQRPADEAHPELLRDRVAPAVERRVGEFLDASAHDAYEWSCALPLFSS